VYPFWFRKVLSTIDLTTLPIQLLNCNILLSSHVKDLGVFLSSDLSWDQHVAYISKKVLDSLRRLKTFQPITVKQRLIQTLIFPLFDDCMWRCLSGSYLGPSWQTPEASEQLRVRFLLQVKNYRDLTLTPLVGWSCREGGNFTRPPVYSKSSDYNLLPTYFDTSNLYPPMRIIHIGITSFSYISLERNCTTLHFLYPLQYYGTQYHKIFEWPRLWLHLRPFTTSFFLINKDPKKSAIGCSGHRLIGVWFCGKMCEWYDMRVKTVWMVSFFT